MHASSGPAMRCTTICGSLMSLLTAKNTRRAAVRTLSRAHSRTASSTSTQTFASATNAHPSDARERVAQRSERLLGARAELDEDGPRSAHDELSERATWTDATLCRDDLVMRRVNT